MNKTIMRVTKDIYEYLTRFVDDKTIISMFSVNKKFNSEEFYTRVLRRKYPLLLTFKVKTMKYLYVHMTHYISKLKTEYDIPYIPSSQVSPRNLYERYMKKDIKSFAMSVAAGEGHMDLVKVMVDKGATDVNRSLRAAAYSGYMDIVKFLLNIGATDIDEAISTAVMNKQIDIVKFLLEKGADVNKALTSAFESEQRDMIEYLISRGAANFRRGACRAASKGNMDLVRLCIDQGVDTSYLIVCAEKGHMDIVQLMLDNGYLNFNRLLSYASFGGQREIIQSMLDLGATNYNRAMCQAARKGHIDIIKWMLDLGATNYNQTMSTAAFYGYKHIVQLMLDLGATNYNMALGKSATHGYKDVVQLMIDTGATDYIGAMEKAVASKALRPGKEGRIQDVIELLDRYV